MEHRASLHNSPQVKNQCEKHNWESQEVRHPAMLLQDKLYDLIVRES
jgi:hypothetical protein